jgi:plastocyanin
MVVRFRLLVALAIAALVGALPATAAPGATTVTLAVNSDAFVISLTSNGKKVTKLKPGTYTFKLVDKSGIHDVHLFRGTKTVKDTKGKGVLTTVGGKTTKTVTVKLTKGKNTFVCDPHATTMKGAFTVA